MKKDTVLLLTGAVITPLFIIFATSLFESLFHERGSSNEMYSASLYFIVAIVTALVAWVFAGIYYCVINSMGFSRQYHWFIVLVAVMIVTSVINYTYPSGVFSADGLDFSAQFFSFCSVDVAVIAVLFVIASFSIRWWSSNCRYTPIPEQDGEHCIIKNHQNITIVRLLLFLVGGTGSHVMRPLIMQLTADIHPLDEVGQPMPLEVVPIIVNPHKANGDLKRTSNLLRWYKQIQQALYGDRVDVTKGFFSIKISTLSDILLNGSNPSDTFLFNMGSIVSKKFNDFTSYSTLDTGNQTLCSMTFSKDQLDTKMDIGFVGSSNIGLVALSQFKDSGEFKQFSNVFQENDHIFVVSNIFGGTGVAGYPIIVKNIHNVGDNIQINNHGDLRDARIGVLTVLPYPNTRQDEDSPISRADFISETKSALSYYHDNLTGVRQNGVDLPMSKVNACCYLGDEISSNPYFNDPGDNGQRNDTHVVEYVGALAVLDFLQIPDDQPLTDNGNAVNPIYKEYGLANDKITLSLKDFGTPTCLHVSKQLTKFHLTYLYIIHQLKSDVGRGYTEDKPEITSGFLPTSFLHILTSDFYVAYFTWLKELKLNQRSFEPFHLITNKLSDALDGIAPKNGLFRSTIDYKSLFPSLNKMSQQAVKTQKYGTDRVACKLMNLLDKTLDELVEEKYNSVA